ncbi:glycosyltransferase family 4 protein [Jiella sp. MQZ13P-4]|uniref:Glycosyltransferase family 4 protein n=2 Tax=Jiella sonneratiae TaxID=2816856 RepID=A0ABS3J057_9HYPH|nr:glycosyltransferase family 4 protein [Jiella sonneratiae]
MGELRRLGLTVDHLRLPAGFPRPSPAERAETAAAFAALADGSHVLVDGLAFGAIPEIAEEEHGRLRLAALVHHPLCLETGLSATLAAALEASERAALRCAASVVVTSAATGETLRQRFGVPADRLTVAPPGTDKPAMPKEWPAGPKGSAGVPLLLSIGTLIPRKDHATLVAALATIADLDWRCRIVGSKTADPQTAAALERQVAACGLSGRVELVGALADVAGEYPAADVFVLASRYEGYGMVFAEALAHGLPVVFCADGAPRDLVPEAAGRRFSPGDAAALADGLRTLLVDEDARRRAGEAAFAAGQALPGWDETGRRVAAALGGLGR